MKSVYGSFFASLDVRQVVIWRLKDEYDCKTVEIFRRYALRKSERVRNSHVWEINEEVVFTFKILKKLRSLKTVFKTDVTV